MNRKSVIDRITAMMDAITKSNAPDGVRIGVVAVLYDDWNKFEQTGVVPEWMELQIRREALAAVYGYRKDH